MPLATRFEELEFWRSAQDFAVEIYRNFDGKSTAGRDFSFVDRIRSATVSISNNIAEGFECASRKEFQRFLVISKRSCGEVRSMLWLVPRLGYLSDEEAARLRATAELLSKRIAAFSRSLGA